MFHTMNIDTTHKHDKTMKKGITSKIDSEKDISTKDMTSNDYR